MDVGPALASGDEPAELGEPREGPLDDPSVSSELGRGLHALTGDPRRDGSGSALSSAPTAVASLVCMELAGPLAGAPPLPGPCARHGIERGRRRHAVVAVRAGEGQAERRAPTVGDAVPFGARAPAIRRVRADLGTPLLAPMEAASSEARDQSNSPARSRRPRSTQCSRSHTSAFCQSRRRRQQVRPEQPNTSRGSISHGRPERSANTIPRKASRSGTRGRPSASPAPQAEAVPPPPTPRQAQDHAP